MTLEAAEIYLQNTADEKAAFLTRVKSGAKMTLGS